MAAPCSAKAIANYFLDIAKRDGKTLQPMKIQKLVYIAHGWHLALLDKPLIEDPVEAWRWGPVIKDLYHEFKEFGRTPITKKATDLNFEEKPGGGIRIKFETPNLEQCSDDPDTAKAFLERVWKVYGTFTSTQLSNMTHKKGAPWDKTMEQRELRISDDLIKDHFQELAKKNAARQG